MVLYCIRLAYIKKKITLQENNIFVSEIENQNFIYHQKNKKWKIEYEKKKKSYLLSVLSVFLQFFFYHFKSINKNKRRKIKNVVLIFLFFSHPI